ncbi:MAG: putative secreted pili protein [Sphingomonas bacterium]|uniref:Csu type fimbrial protein n=1 Tax=Sphingomonas bacterium TaxID=1895847 RepID=UPI0026119DCC|nr:spore coat U domain-containing protein [Sphingomonas bacterium]MDB5707223.1 putative secreted pili protein [Sphingomonas bacterium]
MILTRLLAAGLALVAAPAFAASCTVSSSGVSFGGYDPLSRSDNRSTGSIKLTCDAAVTATVSLTPGQGSYSVREMSNGRSPLAYNLYVDPQHTIIWGDGTGSSNSVPAQGEVVTLPLYGAIPARQNVTAGSYSDTLVVTVSY